MACVSEASLHVRSQEIKLVDANSGVRYRFLEQSVDFRTLISQVIVIIIRGGSRNIFFDDFSLMSEEELITG